jgi:hypothetical protein
MSRMLAIALLGFALLHGLAIYTMSSVSHAQTGETSFAFKGD